MGEKPNILLLLNDHQTFYGNDKIEKRKIKKIITQKSQ